MSTSSAAPDTRTSRAPNRLAQALVAVGAVLGVLSFTVLDWFHGSVGLVHGAHSTVGDIGDLVDRLVDTRRAIGERHAIRLGLSDFYYDWLAWVLLAAVVIVAVVATLPTSEGGQVRALGAIMSGLGIAATFWAFDIYRANGDVIRRHPQGSHVLQVPAGPGYGAFFSHLSVGAWCAVAAFALIGIGAVLGPRRVRD